MAYNNMINRSGATVLIPEEVSREIVQAVPGQSIFLRRAQAMPPMTRKQLKIPVMTGNVEAFFVAGDTGLKQTTAMTWEGVYITAEEIAAIVPIPEAVLDDADYDIWAEVRPRLIEAFARVIDKAAFFGVNKPQSWPDGIVPAAIDAVSLENGTAILEMTYATGADYIAFNQNQLPQGCQLWATPAAGQDVSTYALTAVEGVKAPALEKITEEDEFIEMVRTGGYDTVAADICLKELVPDYEGNWVDLKCFAISGRT